MKIGKSIGTAACVLTVAAWSAGVASAATLIDNTTAGLYNDGIGTLLDGTNPFGGNYMFPTANSAGGDPNLDIPAANEPDLSTAAASLGSWLSTPAMPGGTWSASPVAIPTSWTINDETAIIYEIDGGATGLTNVMADFGVDNGIFVWLNGNFLGGHLRPGGVSLGEFALNLGDLGAGTSYLQILREDHGGASGYSISVTGDVAAVPLPATAWMLIAGLGGLVAARRRKAA
ncbi:MAG: VPLPA-CTERM sorting domain-containing protein [Sedimentitalea sp.]|nr:VPLPA-CTERM sorting domain-containing protein [Sedimentitalea sp.]